MITYSASQESKPRGEEEGNLVRVGLKRVSSMMYQFTISHEY